MLTLGAACSRPVARRTWVFEVPGHGGYRHPARVAAADVSPALAVIPAYDRAGLAATIARTLGRFGPDEPTDNEMPEPHSALARLPESSALRHCLEKLDPGRRSAIVLAYVHGFSHGELAGRLGVPLGTIKSWIRRGLVSLQECLG